MKGLSLVGYRGVPRGSGLRTRDCSGDTADGAGAMGDLPSRARMTERNREE